MVRRVLEQGQPLKLVAEAFGVDPKTVGKWVNRYLADGPAGLADRSSRPNQLRQPTPDDSHQKIISLRKLRFTGQQIARETKVSPATVSRVLRPARLSRTKDLEPPQPVIRYQRENPGDMIHLDIKKLGRFENPGHRMTRDRTNQSSTRGKRGGERWGAGWEVVHVCIDDASRIAFSQTCPMRKVRAPSPSSKQPALTMPASASPSLAS